MLILAFLLAFRIALPFIVKAYVNGVLRDIPGYVGYVDDIDLALIGGSYTLKGLYLNVLNADTEVPFLDFPKTDISLEWGALLKGRLVSEIQMQSPTVIYIFEDQQDSTATQARYNDWTRALTDIVPIDINKLEIYEGKAAFVQLGTSPDIDLELNNIRLTATNLQNVVQTERVLPSDLMATGTSVGQGDFKLQGKLNLIKRIPDMDMSLSLERADLTAINDLSKHYAGIDFKSGEFNVYSEVAIADSYMTGYVKPVLKDAKLIGEGDKFLEVLWEGLVGFFKFILKNHRENSVATRVPIEGDLSDLKTPFWPAFTGIMKNAWIKAFTQQVDEDIEFEDAEAGADERE